MFYSPHPLLRKRETETATVSYSELLFDLIYVFSVTQLSHYLLHNLTWEGLLKETILWFAVWMLWQHTIWVTNCSTRIPGRYVFFFLSVCWWGW